MPDQKWANNQMRAPGWEGPLMVSSPPSWDIAIDDRWCGVGSHSVRLSSTSHSIVRLLFIKHLP